MSDVDSLITTTGLELWYKYESGVSANGVCRDYSGHARHLAQVTDPPTLTANVINGRHGWVFDGTDNPLTYGGGGVPTLKDVFIIAGFADAAFPVAYSAIIDQLSGVDGTTQFYNYGFGGDFAYRKNNVDFAAANQQAPMNGEVALLEISSTSGFTFGGTVGSHAGAPIQKWKGPFVEMIAYSRVLSASEKQNLAEYIAIQFRLWRKTSAGLNIFPFQPNWGQPLSESKRVLSSSAVSGAYKARSKSTQKKGIQPSFESRIAEEYDTAVAFNDEHYPGSTFIWKDDGFSPARETEMRFLSDVQMTRSEDFNDKDYNFQAIEV